MATPQSHRYTTISGTSLQLSDFHQRTSAATAVAAVPDEPWLERNWDTSGDAYLRLRQLYSGYFDHIQKAGEDEKALIDLVLCQLNCFVGVDALLDRKLLLLLVNSFAKTAERHLFRHEFIRLMFFLSFASKEQLEEAVFEIVSAGETRVTVGQLVQMHSYSTQRRMTSHVINLISECDRSGSGLLDVYDFRLLIGKLQEMERRESTQAQPPLETERAKLDEALLEAHELQSWSWDINSWRDAAMRSSTQLRSLAKCRAIWHDNPKMAEVMSTLAWDYPEILSAKFATMAETHCSPGQPSTGLGGGGGGSSLTLQFSSDDNDATVPADSSADDLNL